MRIIRFKRSLSIGYCFLTVIKLADTSHVSFSIDKTLKIDTPSNLKTSKDREIFIHNLFNFRGSRISIRNSEEVHSHVVTATLKLKTAWQNGENESNQIQKRQCYYNSTTNRPRDIISRSLKKHGERIQYYEAKQHQTTFCTCSLRFIDFRIHIRTLIYLWLDKDCKLATILCSFETIYCNWLSTATPPPPHKTP